MEISVSVFDTLDLLRSSIEEEVGAGHCPNLPLSPAGRFDTLHTCIPKQLMLAHPSPHQAPIPAHVVCPPLPPPPPQVVFQATLQVPAHHAMACRIEAYSTPFAAAPALRSPDLQAAASLTEEDQQFAACLASPPDMEEAHEVRLTRPGAEAASFLQRSAPSLR